MRIERRFTKPGQSAYAEIEFRKATSEIKNPDGSIVFRLADIDVPAQFSQVAADILAQKYFRKAGVPARLKKVEENDVPSFLWRSVADEAALAALTGVAAATATWPTGTRRPSPRPPGRRCSNVRRAGWDRRWSAPASTGWRRCSRAGRSGPRA